MVKILKSQKHIIYVAGFIYVILKTVCLCLSITSCGLL